LDLGCGNGRHSIELAKRGFKVIGVDNNPIFLKEAKGLADKEHVEVEWVQADMRNISLSSKFDLVISLFTSFGYFQIDDDDISVINGVARLLKQGGVFFLDIANKEKIIRMFREKDWRKLSNGSTVIIERWFDFEQGREFEKRTIVSEGSKVRKIYCSFRRYTLVEIVKMCKVAGLDYKRSFGDFNGENLGVNSKRCIVISRC
jgi:SAM-dependent methyltransferase